MVSKEKNLSRSPEKISRPTFESFSNLQDQQHLLVLAVLGEESHPGSFDSTKIRSKTKIQKKRNGKKRRRSHRRHTNQLLKQMKGTL